MPSGPFICLITDLFKEPVASPIWGLEGKNTCSPPVWFHSSFVSDSDWRLNGLRDKQFKGKKEMFTHTEIEILAILAVHRRSETLRNLKSNVCIISDRNMLLSASVDMKIKGSDRIKQFCSTRHPGLCSLPYYPSSCGYFRPNLRIQCSLALQIDIL